ncbi:hypothetical protein GCM10017691_07130 [Pseudonocardia petroleophila]|uniref:Secreted protein n=1 Tax=Pseudonocardia petroleophila TaxID=37331 RepID=A0A7G7MJV5_9PSEU|nr:hypothetical protein [Pseudonocardia petroleophila]QNG53066.1 hypothetical protein H6H00_03280 [Pseudonocardia petroleophila]
MSTAVRLAGYATALALVFGVAFGVGSAVGEPPAGVPAVAAHTSDAHGHAPDRPGPDGSGAADARTDGLAATSAGYTLVPAVDTLVPGTPGEYAFTVTGPDGAPVTAYDVEHERPLHLIVVRRDAAGFQHLHPTLGPDGVWRVPLTLPAGGVYRVYADLVPTGGPELVLGTDLFAPGDFTPIPFGPSRVAQVDGYQVRLDGDLVPGTSSPVFATVSLDGAPVTDLEPYLGAFGHLVALRRSDLAHLHVHPDAPTPAPTDRSGPGVAFVAEVPSVGGYRLFFDFRHGGVVRTAEFTVDVG